MSIQPVIEEAPHAFNTERVEGSSAFEVAPLSLAHLSPLGILAAEPSVPAGSGENPYAWQQAYQQASTTAEKSRLFEQARQTYQEQRDYAGLLRLAQEHLQQVSTAQERAGCLLVAGEALIQLQQYQEARLQYLEPALAIAGTALETRLHLWHYLGLSYLAEHAFPAAAAAFRQSADLALGQHFASGAAHQAAQRTQLHHLRNAAYFYDGIIHLIYQHPQQTIQAFQELRRPLTSLGTLNIALYLGLAHRLLQQPEAATRALQVLTRATCPEPLRGPTAIVRAGIAHLSEPLNAVGEHLEMALDVAMPLASSWEPSWQGGLYYELGLALQRAGCRAGAMVCYEEGLRVIVRRAGVGEDALAAEVAGVELLAACERLPSETWSAVLRGELMRFLQSIAWLYVRDEQRESAVVALQLALRLAFTPEQRAALWFQRAWFAVTSAAAGSALSESRQRELVTGLESAGSDCPHAAIARALQGMVALLQGDIPTAQENFAQVPDVPEMPEFHALCVAAWLWTHTQRGALAERLRDGATTPMPPWHSMLTLTAALEVLLSWTRPEHGVTAETVIACVAPLLTQQEAQVLPVLRVLCRPGYLAESRRTGFITTLAQLGNMPEYAVLTDHLVVLLGNAALRTNIDTLLSHIEQRLTEPPEPARSGGARPQRKQQRQQRQAPQPVANLPETTRLQQLIALMHSANAAVTDADLPQEILRWLLRYPSLSSQAPEVVGALLGLLRQCPGAVAVIPTLLEQVPLSRRQRQALEGALQTPVPQAARGGDVLMWESLQHGSLGRLLEGLANAPGEQLSGADPASTVLHWYTAALIFARVGLRAHATTYLSSCLQLQPQQPFVHYQLAQLLQQQQQYDTALHHVLATWHGLQEMPGPAQVWHLEILNQLLALLEKTQQYARFPEWLAIFEAQSSQIPRDVLSSQEQQRLYGEEGTFALFRARYLAHATPQKQTGEVLERQLPFLAQAVAYGTATVRAQALHLQAEALASLQRYHEAVTSYATLVQECPEDQRAQTRLAFYTALQQLEQTPEAPERTLQGLLELVFAHQDASVTVPPPQTPQEALAWLQQAAPEDPCRVDVTDVLTTYAGNALQRHDFSAVIAILTPLYAIAAQPRQAYYLAGAYHSRSQQPTSMTQQLDDSEKALPYAQSAATDRALASLAGTLLQQIQEHYRTLMTAKHREEIFTTYRDRMRGLFTYYRVPFVEEETTQLPSHVWLELGDVADVDESSGELVTTVKLRFNRYATGAEPEPNEPEIALYAQHQRDKQRVIKAHGMEALSWPHTTYTGLTPFAVIFAERLGLNRDLLFVAFADLSVLLRYARVLQYTYRTLLSPGPGQRAPSEAALATAARYCTIIPFLLQRLRTLANASSVKALQRQIGPFREALAVHPKLEFFQNFQVFNDTYTYFREIADTLRPHLDTPPAERESVQNEERQLRRPQLRPKRRQRHLRDYVDEEEDEDADTDTDC